MIFSRHNDRRTRTRMDDFGPRRKNLCVRIDFLSSREQRSFYAHSVRMSDSRYFIVYLYNIHTYIHVYRYTYVCVWCVSDYLFIIIYKFTTILYTLYGDTGCKEGQWHLPLLGKKKNGNVCITLKKILVYWLRRWTFTYYIDTRARTDAHTNTLVHSSLTRTNGFCRRRNLFRCTRSCTVSLHFPFPFSETVKFSGFLLRYGWFRTQWNVLQNNVRSMITDVPMRPKIAWVDRKLSDQP